MSNPYWYFVEFMSCNSNKNQEGVSTEKKKMSKQASPSIRGKGTSKFECDVTCRDDLRYNGKKLTDPINTAEVSLFNYHCY